MPTLRRSCGLLVVVLICSLSTISAPAMQNLAANTPEARIDELRRQFNLAYNAGNADADVRVPLGHGVPKLGLCRS